MGNQNKQSGMGGGSESCGDHLCYIVSQGFNLADKEDYRALVDKPAFQCLHCGGKAKREANLCVPIPL